MSVRCPRCKNKLLQVMEDGTVRLRTEGIHVFKADGTCLADCHWCKANVEVPVRLSSPVTTPPLTVRTT